LKKRIDTVLFDFWITLVKIDSVQIPIRRKYFSYYLSEEAAIPAEKTLQAYEIADAVANNLREKHNKEVSGSHFIYIFAKILGIDDRLRPELEKLYSESVLSLDLKLREGAIEVLDALHQNYKIGLISNTSVGLVVKTLLAKFGIENYFDVVVLSDEVGIRKPEPYIFQYALNKIGSYPEKSIFVGDSPYLDVLGAKASGLYSVFLGNLENFPDGIPRPDLAISSLGLLIDRI